LHRALEDALRKNLVGCNVAGLVDPPRVPKKEMQALTPEEAQRLVAALHADPLEGYYLLSLATGLRQDELLGLALE
jgi:integrase